jgi:hypothetical protein
MKEKQILRNIPSGKNLNLGNIPFNFKLPITVKYKDYKTLASDDSVYVYIFNSSSVYKSTYFKAPLNNENLGTFYLNEYPVYENNDTTKYNWTIRLYKNKYTSPIKQLTYPTIPCGKTQEVIF